MEMEVQTAALRKYLSESHLIHQQIRRRRRKEEDHPVVLADGNQIKFLQQSN